MNRGAMVLLAGGIAFVWLLVAWLSRPELAPDPRRTAEVPVDRMRTETDAELETGESDAGSRRSNATQSASAGSVLCLDLTTSSALAGLVVTCSPREVGTMNAVSRRTDGAGRLNLAIGSWFLAAEGFGPDRVACDVSEHPTITWWSRSLQVVAHVVDEAGNPIPSASVTVSGPAGRKVRSEVAPDGTARLGPVAIEDGCWVRGEAPGHAPCELPLQAEAAVEGRCDVELRLPAAAGDWVLRCVDPAGEPIAAANFAVYQPGYATAPVTLGQTDRNGELRVVGRWMFGDWIWCFDGAAFPWRCAAPPRDSAVAMPATTLTVPRRCEGRFVVIGETRDPSTLRMADARRDPTGHGLIAQALDVAAGQTDLPSAMPTGWPVRLQCHRGSMVLHDRIVTVEGPEWELTLELAPPARTRHIELTSHGAPIARVVARGHTLFRLTPASRGATTVGGAVHLDMPCEPINFEVELTDGSSYQFVGRAGVDDAALTCPRSDLVPVTFSVHDRHGGAVHDVELVLTHQVGSSVRLAGVDGWSIYDQNCTRRLPVDADGKVRARLAVGTYTIAVASLRRRASMGLDCPPLSTPFVHVAAPAGLLFDVVVPRPRLVEIDLGPAWAPGDSWIVDANIGRRRFVGRRGIAWVTEAAHDLRVLDLHEREIGHATVPPGQGRATVYPVVHGKY